MIVFLLDYIKKDNTLINNQQNEINQLRTRQGEIDLDNDTSQYLAADSICKLLNDAYEEHRYQDVIKIGMQLSGLLWYTGKYELRAKVGEIVESAAVKIGDKSTMSKSLFSIFIKGIHTFCNYFTVNASLEEGPFPAFSCSIIMSLSQSRRIAKKPYKSCGFRQFTTNRY